MESTNTYAERAYKEITDIHDQQKIDRIRKVIPSDVESIIDIGCGNGLITNELQKDYTILGADINASKLAFVTAPKILASCDNIPRPDHSFDLVFSSEMIEHLPDDVFKATLNEFERLSKKYILVTVPNREPLHKLLVKCNHCGKTYHKNGHLQKFNAERMAGLFPGWETEVLEEFGNKVRHYQKVLADLKHRFTPSRSWIPSHWVRTQGVPYHFCIHCGERNELQPSFNLIAFILDSMNTLVSPKYPSHLIILLKRKTG